MTLEVKHRHGQIIVIDTEGGAWWPNEAAAEQIATADDPEAEAIRICRDHPMCGTWCD